MGAVSTTASGGNTTVGSDAQSVASTQPPISATTENKPSDKTYAQAYTGVRQDSGDPAYFVKMVRDFYDREGIKDRKTIVFSDSLDIEHCLEYKTLAEEAGFSPSFGVGTFFTSQPSTPVTVS